MLQTGYQYGLEEGDLKRRRTSVHTHGAQVRIVDGEVVRALRRLGRGKKGHQKEKKGLDTSLGGCSSHDERPPVDFYVLD